MRFSSDVAFYYALLRFITLYYALLRFNKGGPPPPARPFDTAARPFDTAGRLLDSETHLIFHWTQAFGTWRLKRGAILDIWPLLFGLSWLPRARLILGH